MQGSRRRGRPKKMLIDVIILCVTAACVFSVSEPAVRLRRGARLGAADRPAGRAHRPAARRALLPPHPPDDDGRARLPLRGEPQQPGGTQDRRNGRRRRARRHLQRRRRAQLPVFHHQVKPGSSLTK